MHFAASSTRIEHGTPCDHGKAEDWWRTSVWKRATGRRAFAKSPVMRGRGIVLVVHRTTPHSTLAVSCQVAIAYGIGKALRVCLLICARPRPPQGTRQLHCMSSATREPQGTDVGGEHRRTMLKAMLLPYLHAHAG